ncbi:MAG: hydroxymethylbilane synthase [Myxococcales bacterium]|nr:hydroxymethylbilane synthase [Myxococcales bacterium]MDH3485263.1 hydroxymethylbilane synthase [Myxococcales bacterium]
MKLRIATRSSNLALIQTRWVGRELQKLFPELTIEEVLVVPKGDRIQDRPLAQVGGKGLFVSEVEAVVVRGAADFAVHSLKDVPGDVPLAEGMGILSVPVREDPRDVLVTVDGTDLASLPRGARVGTTSRRRIVQLQRRRPDLAFVPMRGNIDTRLRKLQEGRCDAIVLAAAGLSRAGLLDRVPHEVLSPDLCLPAVGQGALAIEGSLYDDSLRQQLSAIEDSIARIEVTAERAMLQKLEGNCHSSIAGHATIADARIKLEGLVASYDGDRLLTATSDAYMEPGSPNAIERAHALGEEVAEQLLDRGAGDLIRQAALAAIQGQLTTN